ncbi:MAG TPA: hypothetical protein EYH44_02065, partial [Thermoprotei archaeon]|nr:hypothetical protein [Thermoprotei archaeon]
MTRKVLIFGWDGVPVRIINEAIEKGFLKNFSRLVGEGVYGAIDAVLPIVTPANWYSAFTGVKVDKHGVPNFVVIDRDYRLRYMSISDLKVPGLWDYIGSQGMKGIYVNIPISTPPPKINGIWIADEEVMKDPEPYHVHPNELLEEVRRLGYKIGYPPILGYPREFSKGIREVEDRKINVFYELLRRYEWNLAIYIARSPDYLLHYFLDRPNYMDEIFTTLKHLDRWLGKFMDDFGEETSYIVFSDHGNKVKRGYINLLSILSKTDLLSLRNRRRLKASWLRRSSIVRSFWGMLSLGFRTKISRTILDRFLEIDSPTRIITSQINWSGTKVFPLFNVGGLKVNIAGQYKYGCIDFEEKEKIIKNTLQLLKSVKVEGKEIFRDIEVISSNDPYIPDILVEVDEELWFINVAGGNDVSPLIPDMLDDNKRIDINTSRVADHIREGF